MTETCNVCGRSPATVEYRLVHPVDLFRFWCSGCAVLILNDAPARDFERLETPLDRLHELVSI